MSRTLLFSLAPVTLLFLGVQQPPVAPPKPAEKSVERPTTVSFVNDILPVFTKVGCNNGTCHGQQNGKGGFKLSLRGWDATYDHEQIVKDAGGKRIALKDPTSSLLLRKPLGLMKHGGGVLIKPYSAEHKMLLRWLSEGAKGPSDKDVALVEVAVTPATFPPLRVGDTRAVTVIATYSDKTTRDVTKLARYQAQNDAVADVTETGSIRVKRPGESTILVSYGGIVRTASVLVPFAPPKPAPVATNPVDAAVGRKIAALGLESSPLCTDSEFIRRVYLDTIGLLPTPKETRSFLNATAPDKRAKLVDTLLARPEFADYRTLKLADLLRVNGQYSSEEGADAYYRWIHEQVEKNAPYDQLVRDLLTAKGSNFRNGATNFFRVAMNPDECAETTAQVFLGTRIGCAKCHNHPFENWKQNDYYGMAAFFTRYSIKGGPEFGETQVFARRDGDAYNPRTKQLVKMRPLGGAEIVGEPQSDRRRTLANWLTAPDNKRFAQVAVNRLWADFFGRGIVEPVDDFRVSNPPANSELLDVLADAFIQSRYDTKAILRLILTSQTYQRSSVILPQNQRDDRYFSRAYVRRLPAEALLDAVGQVTQKPDRFWPYPDGFRAAQIRDSRIGHYFLEVFGRPKREVLCACERSPQPNLAQSLHLMNSGAVNFKLAAGDSRIAALVKDFAPWANNVRDARIVEEMYLLTLCRPPSPAETKKMVAHITAQKDKRKGYEDALWALLNSEEFLFQK